MESPWGRSRLRVGRCQRCLGSLAAEIRRTGYAEFQPELSPNGRFLAYVSDESGIEEVYVRSYPDLAERWKISDDGGREPRWSSTGRELFYRRGRAMMAVSVETEDDLSPGTPALLFEGDFYGRPGTNGHQEYDVSQDGRFLMIRDEPSRRIHVVLNWFSELERLVPTRSSTR